ncbi:hypothetical protein KHA80_16660 [Anaerobacillus sp. HL2]|nr:hypothetical protein KHA80_16660 [Anaerobacillus sp. HL2]
MVWINETSTNVIINLLWGKKTKKGEKKKRLDTDVEVLSHSKQVSNANRWKRESW